MPEHQFTKDWFSQHIPRWTQLIELIPKPVDRILEVGCFEGRSTCWILENMLSPEGEIFCVDTFKGGEDLPEQNPVALCKVFHHNTNITRKSYQRIRTFWEDSYKALSKIGSLSTYRGTFSFIYIDGSHKGSTVISDMCQAWPLLKPGGILVVDDAQWGYASGVPECERPLTAIRAFLHLHTDLICLQIATQAEFQKSTKGE